MLKMRVGWLLKTKMLVAENQDVVAEKENEEEKEDEDDQLNEGPISAEKNRN